MKYKILKKLKLILIFVLFVYTSVSYANDKKKKLELVADYDLPILEPSGLCISIHNNELLTVSDKTNKIYRISISGELIDSVNYTGEDLEGVFQNVKDSSIWVAEEELREIVHIDVKGNEIERFKVTVPENKLNNGLEGIAFNTNNKHFYILNEKNPGLLVEWTAELGIINQIKLSFAKDYSGIFYDFIEDKLWIVSDESKTITKCDLKGNKIITYKTKIKKGEGLVVDSKNNLAYVVCDSNSKLYVFKYKK